MRVSGVNIPKQKRILISLQYVYGIGLTRATQILGVAGIDESIRTKDLSRDQEDKIRQIIEKNYTTEGDLRREVSSNIKRLKDIKSYRGSRHAKRLPSRGQRTKRNSRTVRGNVRNRAASGRAKSAQKT
ncbi:MAG: 30S ribosomal protein S13 [Candidatus Magasanikbacteria bacterium]|uniref:Small ribosomal subunit protein uS13 n=1 Tax=Candidatus Magasanikbacteria bacterium CG10_big_fil_rev_8_21_14_0_10_38_6 TaxID=1974647 RepID=A0A2M6NZZ6_9BACT|nr:30S ribosomal protein S13 [Candidatus Magasanikbacteria bacterium]NCS72319.1 30S ribosomal protein S13 [Candidatus Magasanikbacteria bacterium]PIR77034.1 MAG: 30S ribosomal protein S13 [Candidatus Magasanikbacteria bacterium CG10_big_fil_rev_8_21_14_0_10_38_6]